MTQINYIRIKPQAADFTDYYSSKRICVIHKNLNHVQTMSSQNLCNLRNLR